jgi:hypothetical protein
MVERCRASVPSAATPPRDATRKVWQAPRMRRLDLAHTAVDASNDPDGNIGS